MIKNTDCRGPAGQKRFHCGRGIFVWETMPRACAGVLPGMPPAERQGKAPPDFVQGRLR